MCIAKEIVNDFINLTNKVDTVYKELSEKQSKYDKMEQDVLHKLEDFNFNACEGYYLAKSLQKICKQRRIVKNEILSMNSLKSNLNIKQQKSQFENTLKNIDIVEDKIGKLKYHPRILKDNVPSNTVDLKKLNLVNQVPGLKFKKNRKQERIERLFKQISSDQQAIIQ